ncbi:hypothetical protein [Aliiglaciecola sp. LCG003]|uniref:hypothetical protein n=1 Tax=Aliiglaciecola sp. LCG003 TaxID=3053655 RepID=UPI002572D167|nr:hypothetical protein [Aliiglaciecola sp. LCG003]WJG09908.1 hypothetical protein QR722_02410 [Aliiglaciecola sp. LCG003]
MISLKKLLSTTLLTCFAFGVAAAGDEQHFPGVFIGMTNAENETELTYGFEYEYKFNTNWGAGAVYEKTKDAHHGDGITVSLASLYYHPTQNVRLGMGVGREKLGGDHPHSEDLYRLSASYDFHLGDFGVAPTVAVDFIDGEEAYVLGVAFIKPF